MKNPTDLGRIVRLVWGLRFRSFTNTSVGPKLVTLLRHRSRAPSQTRIVVSTSFQRPRMIRVISVGGHACNTRLRSFVSYVV